MVCQSLPGLASYCKDACVVCDLNGYSANNITNTPSQGPPGFCTMIQHHINWLGFIAGSTNLSIAIKVTNCVQPQGLEAGIYASDNCNSFTLVSNCNTDILENTTAIITTNVPLKVGCVYYLVLDGNGGNLCNFSITVVSGSAKAPVPAAPPPISGATTTCPGKTLTYSSSLPAGACSLNWKVDGTPAGSGNSIKVSFPDTGIYKICAEGFNVCNTGAATCLDVLVKLPPPVHLGNFTKCESDLPFSIGNQSTSNPGFNEFHFMTAGGCDSIVTFNLDVIDEPLEGFVNKLICSGSCIIYGMDTLCKKGSFLVDLPNTAKYGCDSLLHVELNTAEIYSKLDTVLPITCASDSVLISVLKDSSNIPAANFLYQWDGPPAGVGLIPGSPKQMYAKKPGQYCLTTIVNSGTIQCNRKDCVTVIEDKAPPQYQLVSDTLHCKDTSGILGIHPGNNVNQWKWSSNLKPFKGDTITLATNIGTYAITVTGKNQCMIVDSVHLYQGASIPQITVISDTITCAQPTVNCIISSNDTITKFQWKNNSGQTISNTGLCTVTKPGIYQVQVVNSAGCTQQASFDIAIDTLAPLMQFYPDTLNCGITTGTPNPSSSNYLFQWANVGPTEVNKPNPVLSGTGNYSCTITSPNNGCSIAKTLALIQGDTIPILICNPDTLNCIKTNTILSNNYQSVTGITYLWSGPGIQTSNSTLPNPNISKGGTYTAVITSLKGCTDTAMVIIALDTALIKSTLEDSILTCNKNKLQYQVTAPQIQWKFINGNLLSTNDQYAIDKPGQYECLLINTNGCIYHDTFTIGIDTLSPVLSGKSDTIDCIIGHVTLNVQVTPSTNSIAWYQGSIYLQVGNSVQVTDAGIYTIIAELMNGCKDTLHIEAFAQPNAPVASIQSGILNCKDTVTICYAQFSPSDCSIQWKNNNGNVISTNDSILVNNAGPFQLLLTTPTQCKSGFKYQVPMDTLSPTSSWMNPDTIKCNKPEVNLIVSPNQPAVITWIAPDGSKEIVPQKTTALEGLWQCVITSQLNFCDDTLNFEVIAAKDKPELDTLEFLDPLCPGDKNGYIHPGTITGGTPPYKLLLNNSFCPPSGKNKLPSGNYELKIIDANQCTNAWLLQLNEPTALELTLEPDIEVEEGDPVWTQPAVVGPWDSVYISTASGYQSDSLETFLLLPWQDDGVTLVAWDKNKCRYQKFRYIRLKRGKYIYAPNVFSPQNDAVNDLFTLFASHHVREISNLQIYDRWGGLVFDKSHFPPNDVSLGWDGTFRGKTLQPGVFAWFAIIELKNGRKFLMEGDVTLFYK